MNGVGGGLFLLRCDDVSVARFSLRRKYQRKRHCQPKNLWDYCIRWFHDLTPSPMRLRLRIFWIETGTAADAVRFGVEARCCAEAPKKRKQNLFCETL
jgi:hypothetical protein